MIELNREMPAEGLDGLEGLASCLRCGAIVKVSRISTVNPFTGAPETLRGTKELNGAERLAVLRRLPGACRNQGFWSRSLGIHLCYRGRAERLQQVRRAATAVGVVAAIVAGWLVAELAARLDGPPPQPSAAEARRWVANQYPEIYPGGVPWESSNAGR